MTLESLQDSRKGAVSANIRFICSMWISLGNCVRTFLGDVQANGYDDKILSISCNLDDMTGEDISFAAETLLNAGALDVYTIPIQMKKAGGKQPISLS